MFLPLQVEVMDRFTAVEAFFRAANKLRGDHSAAARGLAFVQTYAVYEFTVTNVVRTAIDAIVSHGHRYSALQPNLLALFLHPQLQSLKDCPEKDVWDKRMAALQMVFSDDVATIHNTVLPVDGSYFKHTELLLLFRVFGIERIPARRRRHLFRIDEVCRNRHDVSHGNVTAVELGRRYSSREVWKAIRQVRSVCLLLIHALQRHCSKADNHCR